MEIRQSVVRTQWVFFQGIELKILHVCLTYMYEVLCSSRTEEKTLIVQLFSRKFILSYIEFWGKLILHLEIRLSY